MYIYKIDHNLEVRILLCWSSGEIRDQIMPIPTIALYASPSSSVCQINSHASYDVDINGRSTSSASASPSQKHIVGGLSCLFSTPSVKPAYSSGAEDLGSLWHDIIDELGSSSRYSSLCSSMKRDQGRQSPISVLQGPNTSVLSGSRSPPLRNSGDLKPLSGGLFNGFVTRALSSCVEYGSSPLTLNMKDIDPSSSNVLAEELTFAMDDDNFTELDLPPYAKDMLFEAQSKRSIFRDDNVVKAFCEAEKAHRGQVFEILATDSFSFLLLKSCDKIGLNSFFLLCCF